jgi:hypothetical protein
MAAMTSREKQERQNVQVDISEDSFVVRYVCLVYSRENILKCKWILFWEIIIIILHGMTQMNVNTMCNSSK